ncbi:MAG: ribosome recycling factor [Alphaproteobacteria bacterium]
MDKNKFINELKKRMDGAIGACEHNLKGIRTGRASPNFLDPVIVDDVYGDKMHISQLASVSVSDARTITIQVWDKALVKKVEKAISNADLGVTPMGEGQVIRVILPPLTQERRNELVKIALKSGEDSKVAVRNIRRDGMDQLKKFEKDTEISKDEHHNLSEEIQKITDDYVKKIDGLIQIKEKDIKNT